VDDKTIKGATEAGVSLQEYTPRFVEAFFQDRDYLRIRPASEYPRATDYVEPMVRLVEHLLASGVAYRGDDGSVYFSIDRFPAYGRLSRLDQRELRAGASARVTADEYAKEDARDFALWKAARPEDEAVGAAWDAPFGRGRPGWHLECSAMALDLVGERLGQQVLDIHAGGVDLIFPHHEDEIAQSCAYTGRDEFARVWMHGEFMTMAGTKMSKRFGNFLTARDLQENGIDAGAVRLLVFSTHYRQKLDWTDEALVGARAGSRRLGEFRDRLAGAGGPSATRPASRPADEGEEFTAAAERSWTAFAEALDDDLNGPRALAAVFQLVSEGNALLDRGVAPSPRALEIWSAMDGVLDVLPPVARRLEVGGSTAVGADLPDRPPPDAAGAEAWAAAWAARRRAAKSEKNWPEADRIRALLAAHGWQIRDRQDGIAEVVRG
jgi:cysteinyl-tRNA synthetase